MEYPVSVDENGVNFKPEKMEKEKLYHCIFKDKAMLVFKDSQDVMNCYEIEEPDGLLQVSILGLLDILITLFQSVSDFWKDSGSLSYITPELSGEVHVQSEWAGKFDKK